jgi:hypothetical protein
MVPNKEQIDTIVKKIDLVYKDVNKNGVTQTPVAGVVEAVETDPKKLIFLKKQLFMTRSSSSTLLPKTSN